MARRRRLECRRARPVMIADVAGRVVIAHLDFVLTVDARNRVLRDGAVVVEDGRLTAVGPSDDVLATVRPGRSDTVLDGRRRGMVPGFIDAHVHLSETLSRGMFPDD